MYAPNFLDSYDRLVAFDAETTGKHTPSAEFIRRQPCAWKPPGVIIEVGFVEMLRDAEGWRACPRACKSRPPGENENVQRDRPHRYALVKSCWRKFEK